MLQDRLKEAQKDALKTGDKERLSTLRLILAAIKNREISLRGDGKGPISDDGIIELLHTMIKQRRESIRLYEQGGRTDLVDKEKSEIAVIEKFLPAQLTAEEINALCAQAVSELEAKGLKDMGRVMSLLKERHAGSMDFNKASVEVRRLLSA